ncbi:MAG: aquaporin [bacterium]
MKKYIVEAFGTFVLTSAVCLSLVGKFPVSTPVLAGLVIVLFVYTVGHISGAHFNPAITLGAWSIKKIQSMEAFWYLVAQFAGSALALLLVMNTVGLPTLTVSMNWMTAFAEFLGTLLFGFGVASLLYNKVPHDFTGVVAGGSLLLGISIAALLGSNGVLNPAVALGIGSFNLVYAIAPIVGSVVGMNFYNYLNK